MTRLAAGSLATIASGLAVVLASEIAAIAPHPNPVVSQHRGPAATAPQATPPDHTNEWVTTILTRPLFNPGRRPPAEASVVTGNQLAALPRLSGVLVGPFGRNAIFAPEDGKPIIVAEGARVAAWTVLAIEANGVEIVGPDGRRTVHPTFGNLPAVLDLAAPKRMGLSQRQ